MISQKPVISQEVCHIDFNGKRNIWTVSAYTKELLSMVEIENKICQIWSILKTTVELFSDKLIMFLEGLPTSNHPRQIDNTNLTTMANKTVVLDVIFRIILRNHC